MIVAETSYELTDPTIDSQIVKLKAAGADLLYDASTPKLQPRRSRRSPTSAGNRSASSTSMRPRCPRR